MTRAYIFQLGQPCGTSLPGHAFEDLPVVVKVWAYRWLPGLVWLCETLRLTFLTKSLGTSAASAPPFFGPPFLLHRPSKWAPTAAERADVIQSRIHGRCTDLVYFRPSD